MKTYIIITLAIALTSCHILKKDRLTLKTQSQKEQLQILEQHSTLSQKNQLVLIDSSHNDFTMMLWPKGKFKFTLANGFEGEAEKMMITGKQIHQKILKVKEETKQDSTVLKANFNNKKESSTTVEKNKLSIGYSWAWLLVVPVLYFCYWLYKRLI